MASILFVDYQTVIPASWLNDVNNAVYNGVWPSANLTVNNLVVNTSLSGTGVNALFASPPPIGSTAPNTGVFTGLTASGTVTGTGFANYLAAPPVIGGSSPNAGSFTVLNSGSLTVSGAASFTSTGAVKLPSGDTSQRPVGAVGLIRANEETNKFEGYIGGSWGPISSDATNPAGSSGQIQFNNGGLFGASADLTWNGATLGAKSVTFPDTTNQTTAWVGRGSGANGCIYLNNQTVTADYEMPATVNGQSTGPITINTGVTVTIPTGSNWAIIGA